MLTSKFLRRLTAGAAALAVATAATVLSAGVAHTQQELPNLGTLAFLPPTGSDTTAITVVTSGGCTPAGATALNVRVTGPNNFNFTIVGTTFASFSSTDPMTIPFGQTMLDAGALQDPPVPLVAGTYNVEFICQRGFPPAFLGAYTGQLIFTSPTAYTTTTDPTPTPTTSPSPEVSPSPSPEVSPSPSPEVSPSPSPEVSPSPSPEVSPSPTQSPAPGATVTTTTFQVFPSPAFRGLPVVFIVRVSPGKAAGTVQFKDGTTNLGRPARVFGGFALGFATRLTEGEHSLTAEFTPRNPAAYGPSSDSEPLTVRSLFGSLFDFLR